MKNVFIAISTVFISLLIIFVFFLNNQKEDKSYNLSKIDYMFKSNRIPFISDNRIFIYDTLYESVLKFDKDIEIPNNDFKYTFSKNRNLLYVYLIETESSYIFDLANQKVRQIQFPKSYLQSPKSFIYRYSHEGYVVFSPDGKYLGFTSYHRCFFSYITDQCGSMIGLFDIENNKFSLVLSTDNEIFIGDINWSSDSEFLHYKEYYNDRNILYNIKEQKFHEFITASNIGSENPIIKITSLNSNEIFIFVSYFDFYKDVSKIWKYDIQSEDFKLIKTFDFFVNNEDIIFENEDSIFKLEYSNNSDIISSLNIVNQKITQNSIPNSKDAIFLATNGEIVIYADNFSIWLYEIKTNNAVQVLDHSDTSGEESTYGLYFITWLGNNDRILIRLADENYYILNLKSLEIKKIPKKDYLWENRESLF